jgi:hypothetical protein
VHPQFHLLRRHRFAQPARERVGHHQFPTHHRFAMVPPPRPSAEEGWETYPAPLSIGRLSLPGTGRGDRAQRGGWGIAP